jgi:hypothetical protein
MNNVKNRSTLALRPWRTGGWFVCAFGVLGLFSACSADGDATSLTPAAQLGVPSATDESTRVAESLRALENLASTLEAHAESSADPELTGLWRAAASARSAPDVHDFIESLRAPEQTASIDTEAPTVIAYLNALAPVVSELEQRATEATLEPELDAAYGRFMQTGSAAADAFATQVEKKKRPHCCTFTADPVVPTLGCIEVNDNDFNSFFECLGEILGNFSISRGSCDPAACDFIDYE